MFKYFKVDEALKEKLNSYTHKGEYLLVSGGIKYNEIEYREVLFNKKNLLIEEVKGIVYIDENNNIVQDNNIQKSLARLSYYYEIFFCIDKKNNIFKALRNEEDLCKENKDIELSITALEFLQKEKIQDTEKVKNIKLIYSGIHYYDYIKECVNKKRKSFSIRFNKKLSEPLFKLDYQINYFKKLLKTYNEILCMNERDYLKSVYNSEKHNINERLKVLRIENEK
ncbi:hypothetical protein C7M56_13185 [Clostridium botulinum]|uniref:Uncharacterized protein n=1 Tax=Clostridium botulinum TaxID=1491 RepID=A0ABC8CVZ3_CLOBO|nr:hypothetical protein [Clostridium botulinum]AVQ39581.1 hypothetical protein C7M56_13185 [Clostridium botulinum]